jgi:integrase
VGTLYKRGKVWYADFVDRHHRRVQRSLRTRDKEVARSRLRDLELSTTDSGPHASQALSEALDWFTETICVTKPEGTRSHYRQKARHLTRLLGDIVLDDITIDRVRRYIAKRVEEGAHELTIHKELVTLRQTLKHAKERTPPLFHSEIAAVVPRFETSYEPRRTYLTPEQFMAMTKHMTKPPYPKAKPDTIARAEQRTNRRIFFCMMIAYASPRLGELHAMKWEDHVDLRRNMLRIPKGKTVSREIAIAAPLRGWLEKLGKQAEYKGNVVEKWGSCRRDLADACRRAGVPRVTPNDLRRTFASWLVQARESLFVVSTLLGHSSTRMVEKVYGRLDADTLASAVAKLPVGAAPPPPIGDPDCNAGVTREPEKRGERGTSGTAIARAAIVNSVEESAISAGCVVPRDGIEPSTRGFSVRCSTS